MRIIATIAILMSITPASAMNLIGGTRAAIEPVQWGRPQCGPYGCGYVPPRNYEYERPTGPREDYITPNDMRRNQDLRWEYRGRYRYQRGPYAPY
jgi:hypothetical protein